MSDQGAVPHVVVVTAYYNRQDYVTESVQSLVDQTHPNTTVVVVDDGSTDGTWAALQRFSDLPRVKLIRQENAGLSAALNAGIRAVPAEFVAIHGSGDHSHPARLAKQAALLAGRPDIVLVGCGFDNSESQNSAFQRPLTQGHPDLFVQVQRADNLTHGSLMFRRDAFDKVGGYRSFYKYAQDSDLKLRLADLGGYAIVPETLYVRRKLGNSVNNDFRKTLIQEYYVDLSIQAARHRRATGIDLVDTYGAAAAFFRRPSHFLGRRLSAAGLRWRVTHDEEAGRHYIEAARRERLSPRARLMVALGSLPPDSFLWRKVVKPVLARAFTTVSRRRAAAVAASGRDAPA